MAPSRAAQGFFWGLLALVILIVGIAAFRAGIHGSSGEPEGALPVLGAVPDFTLVERSGKTIRASDLRGRFWIGNFIFTRCPGMCPALSTKMAALQRRLRTEEAALAAQDGARLVSFSVDPTQDTPEVLSRYAERFRAEPERWLFLTGPRESVYRLVGEGFQLSVAELPPEQRAAAPEPITHSDRFVVVDRSMRIRAYVHGTDEDVIEQILSLLKRLRSEGSD